MTRKGAIGLILAGAACAVILATSGLPEPVESSRPTAVLHVDRSRVDRPTDESRRRAPVDADDVPPPRQRDRVAPRTSPARGAPCKRIVAEVDTQPRREDVDAPGTGELTFDVDDLPIKDFVEQLQRETDVNLVLTRRAEDVRVSLRAEGLTWREALDRVVRAGGFYLDVRSDRLLRIDYVRALYEFEDAAVREALHAIADLACANLVIGPEVHGTVSASIRDVPWSVAFEQIANKAGFVVRAHRRGVLHVASQEALDDLGPHRPVPPGNSAWRAFCERNRDDGAISLEVIKRPLGELVEQIRPWSDVTIVASEAARAALVTVKLRNLGWVEALQVVAERGACRIRMPHPTLVTIDKPRRISVSFSEADLRLVIRAFAAITGADIAISPDVRGRVRIVMRDLPLRTALHRLGDAHGFRIVDAPHGVLLVTDKTSDVLAARTPRTDGAKTLSIDAIQRPLDEVVDQIATVSGTPITLADDQIGDRCVTLSVQKLPWTHALDLVVGRAGCVIRPAGDGGLVIEATIPVSQEWEHDDVRTVLRSIARLGDARIRIDPEVSGTLTFSATDLHWRHALEAVASVHGCTVLDDPDGSLRIAHPAPPHSRER